MEKKEIQQAWSKAQDIAFIIIEKSFISSSDMQRFLAEYKSILAQKPSYPFYAFLIHQRLLSLEQLGYFFQQEKLSPEDLHWLIANSYLKKANIEHLVQKQLLPNHYISYLQKISGVNQKTPSLPSFDLEEHETATSIKKEVFILQENQLFNNRYLVQKKLGQGGMGVVYQAHDQQLDRIVALKFHTSSHQESIQRFSLEARATAKLHHPNIVTLHDIVFFPGKETEQCALVMDFIEGKTLKDIAREKKLSLHEIIRFIKKVGDAIGYAHEEGIVHRDLKPANIMVDAAGEPKVMDFGLAKMNKDVGITESSAVFGTPAYMSPEQINSAKNVDARTDIYALGLILHELIAKKHPFHAETPYMLINNILQQETPPLCQESPSTPKEIERICLKALEKKREDRYQKTQDFVHDLDAFLAQMKSQKPNSKRATRRHTRKTKNRKSSSIQTANTEESKKLPYKKALLAAALCLFLIAAVFLVLKIWFYPPLGAVNFSIDEAVITKSQKKKDFTFQQHQTLKINIPPKAWLYTFQGKKDKYFFPSSEYIQAPKENKRLLEISLKDLKKYDDWIFYLSYTEIKAEEFAMQFAPEATRGVDFLSKGETEANDITTCNLHQANGKGKLEPLLTMLISSSDFGFRMLFSSKNSGFQNFAIENTSLEEQVLKVNDQIIFRAFYPENHYLAILMKDSQGNVDKLHPLQEQNIMAGGKEYVIPGRKSPIESFVINSDSIGENFIYYFYSENELDIPSLENTVAEHNPTRGVDFKKRTPIQDKLKFFSFFCEAP